MNYIKIATIAKPHGVKGALKVKTDSDFKSQRYQPGNKLYIETKKGFIPVTLNTHFAKGHMDVLTFETFTTLESVEPFKGCAIAIDEADRDTLEKDTFYFSDLVGLDVYTTEYIGQVKAVRAFPQSAMLIIERDGKKDALIPFQKRYVTSVTDDKITIVDMEGLL